MSCWVSTPLESRAHIAGDSSSARLKYPLGTDMRAWQPGLGWHHAAQASWDLALPVLGVQMEGGRDVREAQVEAFYPARAAM